MIRLTMIGAALAFSVLTAAAQNRPVGIEHDWLIDPVQNDAAIQTDRDTHQLILNNGLIERRFLTSPNLASISLKNLYTGEELIRGVKPEAILKLNGTEYAIGGLDGQPNYAYLKEEWLDDLKTNPAAFQFSGSRVDAIAPRMEWKRARPAGETQWPPLGKTLTLTFTPPAALSALQGVEVEVHYNLYQGMPVLAKWLTVVNRSQSALTIDAATTEVLAVVERVSDVERSRTTKPRRTGGVLEYNDLADISNPRIHVQSDYSFCGMSYQSADQTTFWLPDDQYATQVNYDRQWPHMLTCRYPYGPAITLEPGGRFDSFRVFELLFDSDDKERRGLAVRRMQRALAPWATENPTMLHLRYSDSESIHRAVDQCVATGFEMIILSFGSGINMESDDPEYIARIKADFDYAHSKGIQIGGYSLLSSRDAGPEYNVIDPKTGEPGAYFGQAPCLMSEWGDRYFENLKNFIEQTGCDVLEHDGSYPGDPCASTTHNGHKGLEDSQYKQHKRIADFYAWCRARGVFLNVPDYYILSGSNKTGMGYRETNWSLPRAMQLMHTRQNIFDGTWFKSPSMGWMFVPLVEYHGGGAAATIEPLREHLDTYERFLIENLLSGVQACYRGPRLYDADETRDMVRKWVDFYKRDREVLDSEIIHLRRPDGRDYDGILHVNPRGAVKGFAAFFNPTEHPIDKTIALPLYYTGLSGEARVSERGAAAKTYSLACDASIELPLSIEPNGWTWFRIE
ncbi:MAG: alpha-galactosidase [bacterium]|nr:alpha-galactosidase [bacterium]